LTKVTKFNIQNLRILPTRFTLIIGKILTVKSNYFPKQRQPIGLHVGEEVCFL